MSPEEAIANLQQLDDGDIEQAHEEADQILLDVLRSNGFAEVADAWDAAADRISFWYS